MSTGYQQPWYIQYIKKWSLLSTEMISTTFAISISRKKNKNKTKWKYNWHILISSKLLLLFSIGPFWHTFLYLADETYLIQDYNQISFCLWTGGSLFINDPRTTSLSPHRYIYVWWAPRDSDGRSWYCCFWFVIIHLAIVLLPGAPFINMK